MAMSWCAVRRAASCCSSLIGLSSRYAEAPLLAKRSAASSSFRRLPFSTDSEQQTSHKVPLLDGLPFDFIKEYPKSGVIFLRRTTEHEIIKILATTSSEYDDEEIFSFSDGGSNVYDDFDCDDGYDIDDEEDGESSEEEVDRVPRLKLLVKIQFGENFDRCFEFSGYASPNHDLISLNAMAFRKSRKSGEPVGLNHLDEFEDFFKKRGIEPGNFNFLFNYVEKLSEIHNYSASIGKKVLVRTF